MLNILFVNLRAESLLLHFSFLLLKIHAFGVAFYLLSELVRILLVALAQRFMLLFTHAALSPWNDFE